MQRPRSARSTGATDGGGAILFYTLAAAFTLLWVVVALYLPLQP